MKKKGFTLIELLTVIVILAVISLITVPVVNNVIKSVKKSALRLDCNEIYNAYDNYIAGEETISKGNSCLVFDFENDRKEVIGKIIYESKEKLLLNAHLPSYGYYRICNEQKRLIVSNGNYTCIKTDDSEKILDGNVKDIDDTPPVINDISWSSTTSSIKLIVSADDEDGLVEKYYFKLNNIENSSNTNVQSYENLEKNKEYEVEVIVENRSGLKSNVLKTTVKTKDIDAPSYIETQNPENTVFATSKKIEIKYAINPEFQYYFKLNMEGIVGSGVVIASCGNGTMPSNCTDSNITTLEKNTWYKAKGANPSIIVKNNGIIYAFAVDKANNYTTSTYAVTKIDTSEPKVSMSIGNIKTDRVTIKATCSDTESGITKYEYSKDNGVSWISNGAINSYTFKGLKKETNYIYRVKCTNGSGLTKEVSGENSTLGMSNPVIKQTSQTPSSGYEYATNRVIQITYNNSNINSPIYYFKSSVGATVSSGVVIASCGTNTKPGSCTRSNVTAIKANTWYQTSRTTPSITYQENGTLYALTSDGTNVSGTSTYTITKIDTKNPNVEVSVSGKTATFTFSDNVGILSYGVNQSNTEEPSYASTTSTSATWTAINAGTYYVWVKDKAGNTSNTPFTIDASAFGYKVTYIVNGSTYTELVQDGESCLSPKTFTPSLSDAKFLGWSASASSTNVLSSKVMNGTPVTLYAVWKYNDASIGFVSQSYSHEGHMSYGGDNTFITGINTSKYNAITVTISARLSQNYESSYYYVSFRINACGNDFNLFDGGNDGDAITYNNRITIPLGTSGNSLSAYTYQEHDSTGYGWMSMSNAVLSGRTIVK